MACGARVLRPATLGLSYENGLKTVTIGLVNWGFRPCSDWVRADDKCPSGMS
jgi:hypothetical protein